MMVDFALEAHAAMAGARETPYTKRVSSGPSS